MIQNFIISLFILSSFIAKSQTSNIVTASELDAFKINNISLADLKKTQGKQDAVQALLGTITSYKTAENNSTYFVFDGFTVDFSTLEGNTIYIESFEIKNNQYKLTLKNSSITVGDDIKLLGTVVFSPGRNGAKSIIYTPCEDCDNFINIEFDQTNNRITKISYLDMS